MSTTDINNFHIHNIPIDSKYGYFLEVDLRGITCVNVDFQALFLIFRVSKLFRVFKSLFLYFVSLLFKLIYFYEQRFYQESVLVAEAGKRLSQIYGPNRCAGYSTHKSSETKNENTSLFVIKLPMY